MSRHWPLFGLRITTPRLELRLPNAAELDELVDVAMAGVHPASEMPFSTPWTDQTGDALAQGVVQFHWGRRASWQPADWHLCLAAFVDGVPVGAQDLTGADFAARRTVSSGSWLGLTHQGKGLGTEMRRALLAFAFEHLGAERAETAAWHDNAPSQGVTRKLGYQLSGDSIQMRRDVGEQMFRFAISAADWSARPESKVEVTGFDECRSLFGVPDR